MASSPLFTPTNLADLSIKNRVVYPAMTRARCEGGLANETMVEYYSQRASAGLVVTEPSAVSPGAVGYNDTPGMYTEEQALAWSNVTGALHAKGTTVVAQLWHTGRMSHSSFHNGAPIVSASSIPIATGARVPECGVQAADGTWHPHELPRELTTAEVESIVEAFGTSAALAKQAGFDGVEIHAGSGYLIDTFLQSCSNTRADKYGGGVEGRFLILKEIVGRVASEFPTSRIGVKITPNNGTRDLTTNPSLLHQHQPSSHLPPSLLLYRIQRYGLRRQRRDLHAPRGRAVQAQHRIPSRDRRHRRQQQRRVKEGLVVSANPPTPSHRPLSLHATL